MTRSERLAAGWTEHWGMYDWQDGSWRVRGGWKKSPPSRLALDRKVALKDSVDSTDLITARRFWRRKKVRELKVGEEVTLKGTLGRHSSPGWVTVKLKSGAVIGFDIQDLEKP